MAHPCARGAPPERSPGERRRRRHRATRSPAALSEHSFSAAVPGCALPEPPLARTERAGRPPARRRLLPSPSRPLRPTCGRPVDQHPARGDLGPATPAIPAASAAGRRLARAARLLRLSEPAQQRRATVRSPVPARPQQAAKEAAAALPAEAAEAPTADRGIPGGRRCAGRPDGRKARRARARRSDRSLRRPLPRRRRHHAPR